MRGPLAAIAIALSAASACSTPAQLPPGMEFSYAPDDFWQGMGEPTLWRPGDLGRHESRIRLVLGSAHHISNNRAMIRIDRDPTGRTTGHFIRGERRGPHDWVITAQRRFSVSQHQLRELDALIAQSRLWRTYPEYWVRTDGDFCTHAVEMILERVNSEGYLFSAANTCTVPSDYLAVARYMTNLANAHDLWIN